MNIPFENPPLKKAEIKKMYKTHKFTFLPANEFSAALYKNWSYAFCFQSYFQKHLWKSSTPHVFPWKKKSWYMLIIFSGNQILSLLLVHINCRIPSPSCSLWDRELQSSILWYSRPWYCRGRERYVQGVTNYTGARAQTA